MKAADFDLYGHIRACLKYRFWRFPPYKQTQQAARTLIPAYNKDGTRAKKDSVRYLCAHCKQYVDRMSIEVDHIEPVIDPKVGRESIEILIKRQFTDKLQVLCRPCHKLKNAAERALAAEMRRARALAEEEVEEDYGEQEDTAEDIDL